MGELKITMIINNDERFEDKLEYRALNIDFDKIKKVNLNSPIAKCLEIMGVEKESGILVRGDIVNEILDECVIDREYVLFYEYAYQSTNVTTNIKHIVSFVMHIGELDASTFVYKDLLRKYNKPYTCVKLENTECSAEADLEVSIKSAKENAKMYSSMTKSIADSHTQEMIMEKGFANLLKAHKRENTIYEGLLNDSIGHDVDDLKIVPDKVISNLEIYSSGDYLGILEKALAKRRECEQKKPCDVLLQPKPLNTKLIEDAIKADLLEDLLELYPFDKHQNVYLTYFSIKKYSLENKTILGKKIFKEEG